MVRRKRSRELKMPGRASSVEPPGAVTVPTGRVDIADDDAARLLAHRLLTPGRRWPVAVVTVANGASEAYADVDALVDDLRGLAEVVVMPTSDVSWAFSSVMPPLTQVYGGASRVYPVDHDWVSAPRTAPLRFAYSVGERDRVTDQLLSDAMAAAVSAGLYTPRAAAASRPAVDGTVVGLFGSRAMVRLDDGSMATLWEELSGFDVPLERLVQNGQRVRGRIDPATRRLDLEPPDEGVPASTQPRYRAGVAVLAEVAAVDDAALTLRLQPGTEVVTTAGSVTANELDRLTALFTVGDVVVARVTDSEPVIQLSLLDVDDDEATMQAPALLDGGPPWLVAPAAPQLSAPADDALPSPAPDAALGFPPAESVDAELQSEAGPVPQAPSAPRGPTPRDVRAGIAVRPAVRAPDEPVPAPSPADRGAVRDLSLALSAEQSRSADLRRRLDLALGASHELTELRRHAEHLERELNSVEASLRAFREKYRRTDVRRQQLERAAKATTGSTDTDDSDPREWFGDPVDALRLSVTQAWARRVPAGEKPRWPLGDWNVGDRFADSLDNLGPVSWRKLAEVVADVVVADPARLSALENHELRVTESGGAPAVAREDGAVCYRVALQRNSPSARRLHYWRRGDLVELSRVVLHDDTAP